MRTFMTYLRQIFCNHKFIAEDKYCTSPEKNGIKTSLYCSKCGYHRKFWKFIQYGVCGVMVTRQFVALKL